MYRIEKFSLSVLRGIWDKKLGYFLTVHSTPANIVQPRTFTYPFWWFLFEQREICGPVDMFVTEIIVGELCQYKQRDSALKWEYSYYINVWEMGHSELANRNSAAFRCNQ